MCSCSCTFLHGLLQEAGVCISHWTPQRWSLLNLYYLLWEGLVFEILISEGILFASSAAAFSAAGRLWPRPRCDSFHGLEVEHAVPLIGGVHFGFFYSWSSSKICLSLLESTHANPVVPESFKSAESEWGWGMVNSRVEMLVPFCIFTNCQKCLKADVLLWFYLLQVEVWLNHVLDSMRATVRDEMTEAVSAYEEKPREQWLFDYPAQVSAAVHLFSGWCMGKAALGFPFSPALPIL